MGVVLVCKFGMLGCQAKFVKLINSLLHASSSLVNGIWYEGWAVSGHCEWRTGNHEDEPAGVGAVGAAVVLPQLWCFWTQTAPTAKEQLAQLWE